ncbi:MAG: hypothetical protein M1274_11770 [Actinobacteria bacterium]|nr:hypothetical protein [Actinomycetota bacterium]
MKTRRTTGLGVIGLASLAVLVFLLTTGTAFAHGGAEVVVSPTEAAPGATVTITGSGFENGSDVKITLEGVQGVSVLTTLKADGTGVYKATAKLPDVPVGSYQIVAAGGDDKTQADFMMTAAATASPSQPGAGSGAEMQKGAVASGGQVVYKRTLADTITAAALLALITVAGLALLWGDYRMLRTSH